MVAVYHRWALLLAFVCLTKLSCGFNAASTPLPSSAQVAPSVLTSKATASYNKWLESSSSRKCSLQLQAHHDDSTTHLVGNSYCSSSSGSSGLFHQRQHQHHHRHMMQTTTSRLQMTTANSENANNDMSDNNSNRNPLVRIWLKLRVFMARLWVSSSRSYNTQHSDSLHLLCISVSISCITNFSSCNIYQMTLGCRQFF